VAKLTSHDNEYGVSRGIDFHSVSNVINFDFPSAVEGYVHRVGRTARADNSGAALSFISDRDLGLLEQVKKYQESQGQAILPHKFKMSVIEGFRYRVESILGSVNKRSIKRARIEEIKAEILNSQTIKDQIKPNELKELKHDKILQMKKIRTHLKHVPFYLLPQVKEEPITPPLRKSIRKPLRNRRVNYKKNNSNPLKTFRVSKRKVISRRPKNKKIRKDKMPRNSFKYNRPESF